MIGLETETERRQPLWPSRKLICMLPNFLHIGAAKGGSLLNAAAPVKVATLARNEATLAMNVATLAISVAASGVKSPVSR